MIPSCRVWRYSLVVGWYRVDPRWWFLYSDDPGLD